jgi:hypothetical protein
LHEGVLWGGRGLSPAVMTMALQARPGRSGAFITLPSSKAASDYDLCEGPMSLADVCHDQVLAIVEAREARDRDLVIKGVQELIEGLDWYTHPDHVP